MYVISFRCFYANGGICDKRQELLLSDIPKWIECYIFTHPDCISISVKVWFDFCSGS